MLDIILLKTIYCTYPARPRPYRCAPSWMRPIQNLWVRHSSTRGELSPHNGPPPPHTRVMPTVITCNPPA